MGNGKMNQSQVVFSLSSWNSNVEAGPLEINCMYVLFILAQVKHIYTISDISIVLDPRKAL